MTQMKRQTFYSHILSTEVEYFLLKAWFYLVDHFKAGITDFLATCGEHNTDILSHYKLDMAYLLANSWLFIHSADTEQHLMNLSQIFTFGSSVM